MRGEEPASPQMAGLATAYAAAWGVAQQDVLQAVQTSRIKLRGVADAIGLKLADDSPAQRLMERTTQVAPSDACADPTLVEAPTRCLPNTPRCRRRCRRATC